MSNRGGPATYRDELVAARARVETLEEQLAARDAGAQEDDIHVAHLLQQRHDMEKIVARKNRNHVWLAAVSAVTMMGVTLLFGLSLEPSPATFLFLAILALSCLAMGATFTLLMHWLSIEGVRVGISQLDLKIAEARRHLAIERGLHAQLVRDNANRQGRFVVEEEERVEEEEPEASSHRTRQPR